MSAHGVVLGALLQFLGLLTIYVFGGLNAPTINFLPWSGANLDGYRLIARESYSPTKGTNSCPVHPESFAVQSQTTVDLLQGMHSIFSAGSQPLLKLHEFFPDSHSWPQTSLDNDTVTLFHK